MLATLGARVVGTFRAGGDVFLQDKGISMDKGNISQDVRVSYFDLGKDEGRGKTNKTKRRVT